MALTERAAVEIRRKHHVAAGKLTVIPTGVSGERHRPARIEDRRSARAMLGLPELAPVVVAVGALSPEKGLALAIEAVAALPAVHLIIAGDGPERANLEARAAGAASGRVHFTGALADPGVAFTCADVVALSSYTEGLPAVLIEAGLRGLSTVATDVGFVRDIVVNGETGTTVEPGNVIALREGIVRSLELAPSAGAAARARCLALFELSGVADRWTGLLRRIVDAGSRPSAQP